MKNMHVIGGFEGTGPLGRIPAGRDGSSRGRLIRWQGLGEGNQPSRTHGSWDLRWASQRNCHSAKLFKEGQGADTDESPLSSFPVLHDTYFGLNVSPKLMGQDLDPQHNGVEM